MIFMDHSATTPVHPEVFNAMEPFLKSKFGNASTVYEIGREAKNAMEKAREQVASLISVKPEEIIFTGGGTESDNIAIKGIAYKKENRAKHIITTNIEHPAVKETCEYLEGLGFKITYVPVEKNGIIDPENIRKAIRDDTVLITVMHVNNEIGTIQPIKEISKIAKENGIIFHCDAVQSVGKIPVDAKELGVDILSISSHKIYGPKGIGALYIKEGIELEPIINGGGQERDLNPGTENIAGIVGLGKACEISENNLEENMEKILNLREKLIDGIENKIEAVYLNGDREKRLPGNADFIVSGVEGEGLVSKLDLEGLYISTGSACSSNKHSTSHVLEAIGISGKDLHCSLRFTIGPENTEEEVEKTIELMEKSIAFFRELSPFWEE